MASEADPVAAGRTTTCSKRTGQRIVGLFGRKRAGDEADQREADNGEGGIPERSWGDASATAEGGETTERGDDGVWEPETPFSRLRGPFDRSEVSLDGSRVNFGSLWLSAPPSGQVLLHIDEVSQEVQGIQFDLAGSSAVLQAYAAPRTEGVWPQVRGEIAQNVVAEGGRAEILPGPLGKELRLHPRGAAPVRMVGVDGPRWFLRAVLSGRAATDDAAADALIDVIRSTVVDRGTQAMAPLEPLRLTLPMASDGPGDSASDPDPRSQRIEHLRPFERGPEITEVH